MEDIVIKEDFTLPSKGLVYPKSVDPEVTLRSMTTEEEMKRLGKTDFPNKVLSEIINDCLIKKPNINVYDLCAADYQYLLYKLRTVTYGPDYEIQTVCPVCGSINKQTINLDDLKVTECPSDFSKHLLITLPVTKHTIKLRMQTPRMSDEIQNELKNSKSKTSVSRNESAFLLNIISAIDTIDDEVYDQVKLETFLRKLPMKDSNYIIQSARNIDKLFGIDTVVDCKCKDCLIEYKQTLPISREFFEPSID